MLRVDAINKSFGGVRALRDVSIEVRPHEVVGLIGENGAGKSTLMRILSGSMRSELGGHRRRRIACRAARHAASQ